MNKFAHGLAAVLLAGAAFGAAPVLAQSKGKAAEAPKGPKLTKAVAIALSEAQKLQQAGDNAGSLAKIQEAAAVPNPTPDDVYTITALKLNAAIGMKDNTLIENTLGELLATGKVSAADQPKFLKNIGSLALARKDYPKATDAFEKLRKLSPGDADATIALGELYFAQKQSAKAVATIGDAIAAEKAAGKPVPEAWYRRRLAIAYDGKLSDVVQSASRDLVAAYPSAVNWRDALVITRDSFPSLDDQASLDFMRLQAATGSLNGERDFLEYAETALNKGFPGEAQYAINEGVKRNMLVTTKPLVSELKKSADSKVGADKASLPGLEKEAKGNPKSALGTGDAYFGYGDYAKAATLYKLAVGAPNVDQSIANLRLGAALARSGDKAGAETALKAVTGGSRAALAQYWLIWMNRPAA